MKVKVKLTNIKRIDKELKDFTGNLVRVGFPEEVEKYARANEYGTLKIPARPFFRTALFFEEGKSKVLKYAENQVKEIKNGKTAEAALKSIGLYCKGRVVLSIKNGNWLPNKQPKKSKPLIDTGKMINSVEYEVIKK